MKTECLSKQSSPLGSDAGNRHPFLWSGSQHPGEASESSEKGPCGDGRQARHGREHGLSGFAAGGLLRLLRVGGFLRRCPRTLTAGREPVQPERRVSLALAPEEWDSEVDHGQTGSSDRIGVQRTTIDVAALDEQIWKGTRRSQLSYLRPKSALDDRGVEVEDSFALDNRVRTHHVVAGWEACDLDRGAELRQEIGYAAALLLPVGDDADARPRLVHDPTSLIDRQIPFLVFPRSGKT